VNKPIEGSNTAWKVAYVGVKRQNAHVVVRMAWRTSGTEGLTRISGSALGERTCKIRSLVRNSLLAHGRVIFLKAFDVSTFRAILA
jgi:hypothetical protein